MKKYYLLIMILFTFNGFSQSSWFWQSPLPQGNSLNAISFADTNTGVAVGNKGTIVRTTDGGETWNVIINKIKNDFYSLCFIDEKNAIATGSNGTILKTSDAGLTWYKISSNISGGLLKVKFGDKSTGWILADRNKIFMTSDGGETWINKYSDTNNILNNFDVFENHTCIAVGERNFIIKTSDSGKTWIQQDKIKTFKDNLYAICIINIDTIYAAGIEKSIYTINGGKEWQSNYWHEMAPSEMIKLNDFLVIAGNIATPCDCPFRGGIQFFDKK